MIILKSKSEIERMKKAGELLAACHQEIAAMIRPGISTWEIDQFVEDYLKQSGASPEQKGYQGYAYATCASVNDEICHGFPRKEALQDGDIVTIDMVVNLNGALADSAWSYTVGTPSEEVKRLFHVTKTSLYKGIEQAVVGKRVGDISHAIQSYVEPQGFSVVRDFCGHGIGNTIHEAPEIPHFGVAGRGQRLKEGMVITIEPMINTGGYKSSMDPNKWTARTADGSLSTQFEHTVAITKEGPLILTEQG